MSRAEFLSVSVQVAEVTGCLNSCKQDLIDMSMGKKYLDRKFDLDINDGGKHTHVLHFYVSRPIYTIQGSVLSQVLGNKLNKIEFLKNRRNFSSTTGCPSSPTVAEWEGCFW